MNIEVSTSSGNETGEKYGEVWVECESIRLNYNIFVGSDMTQFATKLSFGLSPY